MKQRLLGEKGPRASALELVRANIIKFSLPFFLLLLPFTVCARQIDTFYGSIEVEEPILLELIDSPIFQRLKFVHQYGIAYYTTHREEYSRYDHSIGVFTILRAKGASLEEQVAGLLHDVSHTVFSHVGDWIFGKENQEKGYQESIHLLFLEKSGLNEILRKYHLTANQILPKAELFPALEASLPNLCADRIDYNIQGAYYQGFITYDEALSIFHDLQFIDEHWVSTSPELMKKLSCFSLFMTKECWGSPLNYATSRWLADAILRAISINCVSLDELHFGTDQAIWDKLLVQKDAFIEETMGMILNPDAYFSIVDPLEADLIVKSKFRGIDPLILSPSSCSRLTSLDVNFASEYQNTKNIIEMGWPIKITRARLSSN